MKCAFCLLLGLAGALVLIDLANSHDKVAEGSFNHVQQTKFTSKIPHFVPSAAMADPKFVRNHHRQSRSTLPRSHFESWVRALSGEENYDEMYTFSRNYPEQFRAVLPVLISRSYIAAETNFGTVLGFIKNLPWLEDQIIGFDTIYSRMEKRGESSSSPRTLMLAFSLRESKYDSDGSQHKVSGKTMAKADLLKSKLPAVVRTVVFGGSECSIKNKYSGLYITSIKEFDENSKCVFSWERFKNVRKDSWTLETPDQGDTWHIKNGHWRDYLHADQRSRVCRLQTLGKGGVWRLTPVGGGQWVSFVNAQTAEVMYANGSMTTFASHSEGNIWTLQKPEIELLEKSQWEVTC